MNLRLKVGVLETLNLYIFLEGVVMARTYTVKGRLLIVNLVMVGQKEI